MRASLLLLAALLPAPAGGAGAQTAEAPAATLRVLVQNIYGRREKDCEARYKALAEKILSASPPYDVVALNEHWRVPYDRWFSCDADVLTKALEKDGRYAGKDHSIKHLPRTDDVLQVAGGNSIFSLHPIVDAYEARFPSSRDVPLSGYALARVRLAPGVTVDVWDVHLEANVDGCDDDCRWEQATDLGSAVELFSGLPEKGSKGNPVLVVGDFNTGGPVSRSEKPPYAGNGGYDHVFGDALRGARDVWLELDGGGASGYTYDCSLNSVQKCKSRERIDYVLVPEHEDMLDPASEHVLVPVKIEVARFATPAGGHVSDHFGLDVTVEVRPRPKPAASVAAPAADSVRRVLDSLTTLRWD